MSFIYQIFKTHPLTNRPWSNVWIVDAATLAAAEANVGIVIDAEKTIHHSSVLFTYARVSSSAPDDNVYSTVSINQNGERGGLSSPLPLFNTARVLFNVTGGGRPSQKYFRLPLLEEDVDNGNLVAGLQATIDAAMEELIADMVEAGTFLVDPDNQAFVNSSVQVAIQMRQLHRKRRRSTTP